jgi:hypothetical protein
MMNKRDFCKNICSLILEMISDGNQPIMDWLLRSLIDQQQAFKDGYSKLDGVTKLSAHQMARALDIYFCYTDTNGDVQVDYDCSKTGDLHAKYHAIWVSKYGGKEIIEWDKDHYEG